MGFRDAMDAAEEPIEIFHVGDNDVWKSGMSETTVQDVAEKIPDEIYFVSTEEEVFDAEVKSSQEG